MNIIKLSIQRPIFIFMTTLFVVVVGALALRVLPVDLYPNVSYPMLAVRANLSGAAPEEMEQLVTKPLEDALSSIAGLTTLRSSSREGMSFVMLEFDAGVDIKFQEIQVRAKVANLKRSLPEELSEPVVARQDPDDTPIIELAITGNRTASELTKLVEDKIAERIRQINGVGEVDLGGGRNKEILIELKPEAIEAWQLNITEIVQAIKNFNSNDPIGTLRGSDRTWLLRSPSSLQGMGDLIKLPVSKTKEGKAILLRDVASVKEGFSQVSRISRINNGTELRPSVDLDVMKQSGENTVAVSNSVLEILKKLKTELPNDIEITIMRDNADLIRTNVADVFETLIIGAILTIIVVLLFLRSPRATITTGISLPSSIIATFAIMYLAGFTVNIMTLLALSLAIGLLVDDAIVVRENIFRHLQNPNLSVKDAVYLGASQVSLAVVATTLTIVAVFLPVGFMGGTVGQFFKQFAVTVVFAIIVSLWDALTMAPMLSTYFANIADPAQEWKAFGFFWKAIHRLLMVFEHFFDRIERLYSRLLAYILPRPWFALILVIIAVGSAVVGFQKIGKSFLPTQLGQVFSASLSGPLAIPIEQVNKVAIQADKRMSKIKGLEYWTVRASSSGMGGGSVSFTIRIKEGFAHTQDELADVRANVRTALQGFAGYSVRISEPSDPLAGATGGGGGRFQPVAVMIAGEQMSTLRQIAREVQATMESIPGITDVMAPQDEGLPELKLKTSPQLAGHFGVSASSISSELRNWIEGNTSNRLLLEGDQVPIRIRLFQGEQLTPSSLMAKSIFAKSTTNGKSVAIPISNVAELTAGAGASVINRENRQKVTRIGANLARGATLGTVVNALQDKLNELALPDGYTVRIVGQSEQMGQLFKSIIIALLLGGLFMYMILASLFESFAQPITVMIAIPLAATGAVLALMLFNMPLDLYGGIGMILLAGIVAKNSILLVDFAVQKVRSDSITPMLAILQSAPLRLRPIVMTSVAMIAGMLPVATGLGVGGAARQSLGIATIGGIISSTFLTLIIVPNFYVIIEKVVQVGKRVTKRT